MKKIFILFTMLVIVCSVAFAGCKKQSEESDNLDKWKEDGSLKILAIGNSFSEDALEYSWNVATSLGIEDVMIGHLYIGGCSLDTHYANAINSTPAYDYRINFDGRWQSTPNFSSIDAISGEMWDFISIQQVSGQSGVEEFFTSLDGLVSVIKENNSFAQIVWHQTWAYQQNNSHGDFARYDSDQLTMYNAICSVTQNVVLKNENIVSVIPSGTAIQNARTSALGDTLTRDGYHLSLTGRYIGALAYIYKLTGVDISNIEYSPALSDTVRSICVESVINAVKTPYSVTQSQYR